MEKMYKGLAFSPLAKLTAGINDTATIIPVDNADAFPPAPNYATIGVGDTGETILYTAKTTDSLSGCQRGIEGTAKTWGVGEIISRNFTAADHDALIDNVTQLFGDIPTKLDQLTGDPTHRTVTDAEKAKWDGKSDFSGNYADLAGKPTIPTTLAELAEDESHRTVTDFEKQEWSGKSDFPGTWSALTGKPNTFPPSAHSQVASTIQAGTFAGQVKANASGQSSSVYALRNQKISLSAENPTVEGEICWLAK